MHIYFPKKKITRFSLQAAVSCAFLRTAKGAEREDYNQAQHRERGSFCRFSQGKVLLNTHCSHLQLPTAFWWQKCIKISLPARAASPKRVPNAWAGCAVWVLASHPSWHPLTLPSPQSPSEIPPLFYRKKRRYSVPESKVGNKQTLYF